MDFDLIVIGGGLIGLAVAVECAEQGVSTAILERHCRWGMETSSRNSEVIHSGFHYPSGSLKAWLAVEGNARLYDFSETFSIPFLRTGKITVAFSENEEENLLRLYKQGKENGVENLEIFSKLLLQRRFPGLTAQAALFSPSTGIISAHSLMDCLAKKFQDAGGIIALGSNVTGIERSGEGYLITLFQREEEHYSAANIVNAAGLFADHISTLCGIPASLFWGKGDYFRIHAPFPFDLPVYPVPESDCLGIHCTPDLGGGWRLGPDIEYVEKKDFPYPDNRHAPAFSVDRKKRALFLQEARKYVPELREEDLFPESYGIRAKIGGPGEGFTDFIIREEAKAGRPGFINLMGIDSPGLTASLAIGKLVAATIV